MRLDSKGESYRQLLVDQHDGGFILTERESYKPIGYQRSKWETTRIFITADEIKKLAQFAEREQS